MGDGRTEDAHHRVADELLHRSAVALDLLAETGVVRTETCPHVLGSACSEAAVKPTRSQNRTVTTLRSSRAEAGGASLSGAAHSLQNFALSGFSVPQEGQTATGGV